MGLALPVKVSSVPRFLRLGRVNLVSVIWKRSAHPARDSGFGAFSGQHKAVSTAFMEV